MNSYPDREKTGKWRGLGERGREVVYDGGGGGGIKVREADLFLSPCNSRLLG